MFPAALDPRDHRFLRMLALSGAFHVAAFAVLASWSALSRPRLSVAPVAVVDLVGGAPAPAAPEARPGRDVRKDSPAGRAKEERNGRKARRQAAKAKPAPVPAGRPKAATLPDTRSLADTIRKLRQEKTSEEEVEAAVRGVRHEKEIRQAVRGIGERVARRVDLTAARTAPRAAQPPGPPAGIAGGGAAGVARLPPEHLAYFRALDEKVRANWTVPDLGVKDPRTLFVQIRVTIERDGRVSDIRMEKSSGTPYFDDSVLRAVRKASPLPVPPEQLRGGESRYEVGFRFYGAGEAP